MKPTTITKATKYATLPIAALSIFTVLNIPHAQVTPQQIELAASELTGQEIQQLNPDTETETTSEKSNITLPDRDELKTPARKMMEALNIKNPDAPIKEETDPHIVKQVVEEAIQKRDVSTVELFNKTCGPTFSTALSTTTIPSTLEANTLNETPENKRDHYVNEYNRLADMAQTALDTFNNTKLPDYDSTEFTNSGQEYIKFLHGSAQYVQGATTPEEIEERINKSVNIFANEGARYQMNAQELFADNLTPDTVNVVKGLESCAALFNNSTIPDNVEVIEATDFVRRVVDADRAVSDSTGAIVGFTNEVSDLGFEDAKKRLEELFRERGDKVKTASDVLDAWTVQDAPGDVRVAVQTYRPVRDEGVGLYAGIADSSFVFADRIRDAADIDDLVAVLEEASGVLQQQDADSARFVVGLGSRISFPTEATKTAVLGVLHDSKPMIESNE